MLAEKSVLGTTTIAGINFGEESQEEVSALPIPNVREIMAQEEEAWLEGGGDSAEHVLLKAVDALDIDKAREIIASGLVNLDFQYPGREGMTALHTVINAGEYLRLKSAEIEAELGNYQDVLIQESKRKEKIAELTKDVCERSTLIVEALLVAGANPNVRDAKSLTPLDYAVMRDSFTDTTNLPAAAALLESPEMDADAVQEVFLWAISTYEQEVVELLLEDTDWSDLAEARQKAIHVRDDAKDEQQKQSSQVIIAMIEEKLAQRNDEMNAAFDAHQQAAGLPISERGATAGRMLTVITPLMVNLATMSPVSATAALPVGSAQPAALAAAGDIERILLAFAELEATEGRLR
jgi:hypothetical protein